MNVEDLVEWSLANKMPKGMKHLNRTELENYFTKCLVENRLIVDVIDNKITGYVTYRKMLYVEEIQTNTKNTFRKLILLLKEVFPTFGAMATRHGKLKHYNVSQLIKKI